MTATQKSAAVWFLFGLSGAGKSNVGDVISQHTGWPVYHADIDITAEMKLALTEARPFTDSMRDEYFSQLLEHIKDRQQSDLPLIVTQGAYKQKHRDFLRKHLPQLTFVWVDAPLDMIIKRLEQRGQGIRAASAAALFKDFEPPRDNSFRLINDGDKTRVLEQSRQAMSLA
jgi:carbohydrate kinase (thermoresistant glucokinase family)